MTDAKFKKEMRKLRSKRTRIERKFKEELQPIIEAQDKLRKTHKHHGRIGQWSRRGWPKFRLCSVCGDWFKAT